MNAAQARNEGPRWSGAVIVMMARLLALSALLALLAFVLPRDSVVFYAFMALAYIVTIPYALWSRDRKRINRLLPMQFVVDLVVVTGVVYFTGGLRSDLTLLYPLVILSAGIVVSPRHAVRLTVLSCAVYATLIVLMEQNLMAPYGGASPGGDSSAVTPLALRLLVFGCFGLASAYVSQRCEYADRRVSHFRQIAEVIFRNVRAGLLLLDDRGRILLANDTAARLLGHDGAALVGAPIGRIADESLPLTAGAGGEDAQPYFLRADGTRFPVSVETSWVSLPGEMVPGLARPGRADICVLVFSDVSHVLEMKERVAKAERVKSAIAMAARMADEIRNPLAAVSGATQLIRQMDRRLALARPDIAPLLLDGDRVQIEQVIERESQRLDEIVQRFINSTEFSPEAIGERLAAESDRVRMPSALVGV